MPLYSLDIQIVGTAYIKAESEEKALELANGLVNTGLEFSSRHQSIGENVCMDGRPFECLADNDEDIAFSPAMTISGTFNGEGLSLVDEEEANA